MVPSNGKEAYSLNIPVGRGRSSHKILIENYFTGNRTQLNATNPGLAGESACSQCRIMSARSSSKIQSRVR